MKGTSQQKLQCTSVVQAAIKPTRRETTASHAIWTPRDEDAFTGMLGAAAVSEAINTTAFDVLSIVALALEMVVSKVVEDVDSLAVLRKEPVSEDLTATFVSEDLAAVLVAVTLLVTFVTWYVKVSLSDPLATTIPL